MFRNFFRSSDCDRKQCRKSNSFPWYLPEIMAFPYSAPNQSISQGPFIISVDVLFPQGSSLIPGPRSHGWTFIPGTVLNPRGGSWSQGRFTSDLIISAWTSQYIDAMFTYFCIKRWVKEIFGIIIRNKYLILVHHHLIYAHALDRKHLLIYF